MSNTSRSHSFPTANNCYLLCDKAIMMHGSLACQWLCISTGICLVELVIRGSHNTISTLLSEGRQHRPDKSALFVSSSSARLCTVFLAVSILSLFCSYCHHVGEPSMCQITKTLVHCLSDWPGPLSQPASTDRVPNQHGLILTSKTALSCIHLWKLDWLILNSINLFNRKRDAWLLYVITI